MNEQYSAITAQLDEFIKNLKQQKAAPDKELIDFHLNKINTMVEYLKSNSEAFTSKSPEIKFIFNLSEAVNALAEIFEDKFCYYATAVSLRNAELETARLYESRKKKTPLRSLWEIYLDIAKDYSAISMDLDAVASLTAALKSLEESGEVVDKRWVSYITCRLAYAYRNIAPNKSISFLNKSTKMLEECNEEPEAALNIGNYIGIISNYINISIILLDMNQYTKALKQISDCLYLLKSLELNRRRDIEFTKLKAYAKGLQAKTLYLMGEYVLCEQSVADGVQLCDKIKAYAYSDFCDIMDILYSTQSLVMCEKEKYMTAIEYQYKLLAIWSEHEDDIKVSYKVSNIYSDISKIYFEYLHEYILAVDMAKLSLKKLRPYANADVLKYDNYGISAEVRGLINLADAQSKEGFKYSALLNYEKGLSIIENELKNGSEKPFLLYAHAHITYQLSLHKRELDMPEESLDLLITAYKYVCKVKKYGGKYKTLYDIIYRDFTAQVTANETKGVTI